MENKKALARVVLYSVLLYSSAAVADSMLAEKPMLIRPREHRSESATLPSGHIVLKEERMKVVPRIKELFDEDNELIALVNKFLKNPGENLDLLQQIKDLARIAHFDQGNWDYLKDVDAAGAVNPNHVTPLMFYALVGDRDRLEQELSACSKAMSRKYDKSGANVLGYAVLNTEDNAVDILKFLIEEKKIPLHQQLANGWTLLMIAVQNPTDAGLAMVKYLLGQDSDKGKAHLRVNETAHDGTTALMVLLDSNFGDNTEDMVKVMLDAGARITNHSKDGVNEVMVAAACQSPSVVATLLNIEKSRSKNPARLESQDKQGLTALHYAIEFNRDAEVAQQFVDAMDGAAQTKMGHQTATINLPTKDGKTPLDTARNLGRAKVARILTAGGVGGLTQVEVAQGHGKLSTFQYNAGMGNVEAVRDALKGGRPAKADGVIHRDKANIDINRADHFGCTPLHLAIRNDSPAGIATAEVLLEDRMIKVNEKDVLGRTPLMFAVMNRSEGTVQLVERLLQEDADVSLKDHEARTALMLLILAHNGPSAGQRRLSRNAQLLIAQALIDASSDAATQTIYSDLQTKDAHGFSALDYAQALGRNDLAMLIKAGIAQQPAKKDKK